MDKKWPTRCISKRPDSSGRKVHIFVVVWVYVTVAVSIKLDFDSVSDVQWVEDQNGMSGRFTLATPTTANWCRCPIGTIVFTLRINHNLKKGNSLVQTSLNLPDQKPTSKQVAKPNTKIRLKVETWMWISESKTHREKTKKRWSYKVSKLILGVHVNCQN